MAPLPLLRALLLLLLLQTSPSGLSSSHPSAPFSAFFMKNLTTSCHSFWKHSKMSRIAVLRNKSRKNNHRFPQLLSNMYRSTWCKCIQYDKLLVLVWWPNVLEYPSTFLKSSHLRVAPSIVQPCSCLIYKNRKPDFNLRTH